MEWPPRKQFFKIRFGTGGVGILKNGQKKFENIWLHNDDQT